MEVFEGGLGKLGSFRPHPITCKSSYVPHKKENMQIFRDLGLSMFMLMVNLMDIAGKWLDGYGGRILQDLNIQCL